MPVDQSLVSVIIPAYNCSEILGRCIESVLEQSVSPKEIIVINDGSTDKTGEIAKRYQHHITYLKQENRGQGAARNAGLELATGRNIAFLDADDFWLPDFLKMSLTFLADHPNAVAVSTGYILKKIGHELKGPILDEMDRNQYGKGAVIDDFFRFWAKYDHIRTGTALIKKEIIDKAGRQREDLRMSQDLEYWGYLATFGSWGFIPDHLWVGDSAPIAAGKGWGNKYFIRRKRCPSVESWEKRIVGRLKEEDKVHFSKIRGRIANSFAYNKLLAGDKKGSKDIVARYKDEMPDTWTSKAMKAGFRGNVFTWEMICWLLRLREKLKSSLLYAFPNITHRIIKLVHMI